MKKVLLVSDSPYATTGLGKISHTLLKMLPEFEWSVWGFLHTDFRVKKGRYFADYDESDYEAKFKIVSPKSYTDNQYGFDFIPSFIETEKPDFLITTVDFDRILPVMKAIKDLQFTMDFKWINYFPVDRVDFKYLEADAYRYPDINVCYSQYGVEKLHAINPKLDIRAIHCAVDVDAFPELTKEAIMEFKKTTWKGSDESTFLAGTVNRSFARKDTPRLVAAFAEFLKNVPNTLAYVHGSPVTFEGTDLRKLAYEWEVPQNRLAFMPKLINETSSMPVALLNKIYRSMDVFVTVAGGEGFGYTAVEAMLCGVPVVAPNHTTFPELIQDFGKLVDPKDMSFHHNGTTSMWPTVHIADVVDAMIDVYEHPDEYKKKALKGSKWVRKNLNYKVIGDQWREILK